MPVSDHALLDAWKSVLTLSGLAPGANVTVLTGAHTHAQTLAAAIAAVRALGAVPTRVDLEPLNAEKSLSRDPLAYLGTTPLTGNRAAMAACLASDLVIDLMLLLFSPEQQQILESGTRVAAEYFGSPADFGTIAKGRRADLILLDGNPLEDLKNTAKISQVMKNGRLYDAATLNETWPRQKPLGTQWWWKVEPPAAMRGGR